MEMGTEKPKDLSTAWEKGALDLAQTVVVVTGSLPLKQLVI